MRESWQAVVCLPLMELSPAHGLARVFVASLARSPVGVPVPQAIGGAVVSSPIIARIRVGGRVVAVPIAIVGGVAVAIVGSGAGRERPKGKPADETCRKCPAAIVRPAPSPTVAAPTSTPPPLDLFGRGRSRDLLD